MVAPGVARYGLPWVLGFVTYQLIYLGQVSWWAWAC
jgi:hypothetical protein